MRHYITFSSPGGRHYFHGPQRRDPLGEAGQLDSFRTLKSLQHCPLCRKQCDASELGCSKGRDFFSGLKSPEE